MPSCPLLGSSWGHLGTLLDPLGAILGPSWAILEPPWALLGPPWGHLVAILAHLGAMLGHLWPSLAPSWATLELSWAMLGLSWANLVTCGPLLEPSGRLPGPCRAYLEAVLTSSWGHFGGILRYCGRIFLPFCGFLTYRSILAPLVYLPQNTPHLEVSSPRGASAGTRSAYNPAARRKSMQVPC